MRKITADAIRAFNGCRNFKRDNTEVIRFDDERRTELRLHGNLIAVMDKTGLNISNAGWATVTTKERLNGFSQVGIYQTDYIWYLNGEEWGGEWVNMNEWAEKHGARISNHELNYG